MLKKPVIRNTFSSCSIILRNNLFHLSGELKGIRPSKTKSKAIAERKFKIKTVSPIKKG